MEFVLDSLKLQAGNHTVAMTFCETMLLTKEHLLNILTDYPLEMKVIRKHSLMIAWRLAVRFFIKYRRQSHLVNPLGPTRRDIEKRRISVSYVNLDNADEEGIFGDKKGDYFRDRDMRRAERDFGEFLLHPRRHK